MHLDDETLRALLDRQTDSAGAAEHLAVCSQCRERLVAMQERAARVSAHLAVLDPGPADAPYAARVAYAQLKSRRLVLTETGAPVKEKLSMVKTIFSQRLRPVWMGLCALAVVTVAFSFPSVRAFAGDLLARLRVSQVAIVQVDNNRLDEFGGNTPLAKQLAQLVSDSIKTTKEGGKPQVVASAAEASQTAGFAVRTPGSRTDKPTITVQAGGAFQFIVNRARAQKLLDEAGASNIKLPANIDGANVSVTIPSGVSIAYGDCPKPGQEGNSTSAPRRVYANCTMVVEMPSPTVDTPPTLDVKALAELGLQFGGMTADQARAFSQKVDWTSTLVIPIPRNGASYKEVSVDGTSGYVIQRPVGDAPQYAVVWVKNGIVYAVGGLGTDTTAALAMANSLK